MLREARMQNDDDPREGSRQMARRSLMDRQAKRLSKSSTGFPFAEANFKKLNGSYTLVCAAFNVPGQIDAGITLTGQYT